ncbi:hypothetical protein OIU74_024231, partial [Salix koriyanagi]
MVSSIITRNTWNRPDILGRWNGRVPCPNSEDQDHYIWKGTGSGQFTISSAWHILRPHRSIVSYASILWHPWHIPRHSFTLWLAIKGRLRTIDRMYGRSDMDQMNICSLCSCHPETHSHIFFQCSYAKAVWQRANVRLSTKWPEDVSWNQTWEWGAQHYNCKETVNHRIPCMILAATVYHLWYERNARTFNDQYRTIAEISEEIQSTIRLKIASLEDRHKISPE